MWAALRSDLEEFVTTVKDESASILPTTAEANDDRRGVIEEEDHKQQGVIVGEDGDVMYEDYDRGAVMEEIDRLICEEETFLEPLDTQQEEVTQFLLQFDIESKTDDISKLLEENPETLQVQFESLVPTQISYKEFWERFYFRCDEERIQRQWEREQEEKRKARAEAISAGVQGVKNLFGGAVKAVSSSLSKADESVDAVTARPLQFMPPPPGAGAGGINLFGASGRPPFVMNTAVDEGDDDEEEELGWDDDEEDLEDSEDEEYEEGDSEEVVEFSSRKDEELEKVMQQLTIATEERDQLHNTVEMQAKEIAKLMSGDTSCAMETKGHDEKALAKLKMELFEKDAELAALKASLEDTHEDSRVSAAKKDGAKLAAQEREVKQLLGAAMDKETEIAGLKTEISKLTQELDKAVSNGDQLRADMELDKKALATSFAEKEELEEQLRATSESDNKEALAASVAEKNELEALVKILQEKLAVSQSDADSLREMMESSKSCTASQILAAQNEAAGAKALAETLAAELEELKGNLHFTAGRADHLEVELQQAKDALKKQEAEFAAKMADEITKVQMEHEQLSADTTHSESTGVKVAVPSAAPPTVTSIPGTADKDGEEEDWGDDWGDEDE
jgi:hypothetical protein